MAATVLAAVLAGGATGLGLHAWKPDPLAAVGDRASDPGRTGTDPGGDSAGPTPGERSPGTPTASPDRTPSGSPTPHRSASPTPSARRSTSPAFTRAALLRTYDFTANGWATASVTDAYDELPDTATMPCTTITSDDTGVVEGYAAAYASHRTEAYELVARYRDEAAAQRAYSQALDMIANCADTAYVPKVLITGSAKRAEASGVDAIHWFDTQASKENTTLGVIGVVRAQDRIAVLEMSSSVSDPDNTHAGGTTDVANLLGTSGKRLV